MVANWDYALTQASRAAAVILELVPDWEDDAQVTIDIRDIRTRWLRHYPRHSETQNKNRTSTKLQTRTKKAFKRLEELGLARRGVGRGGSYEFILIVDIHGLRDLALNLENVEDVDGLAVPVRTPRPALRCRSGKKTYGSQRAALHRLLKLWQERERTGDPHRRERSAYQCPLCNWWHLTSQDAIPIHKPDHAETQ